MTSISSVSGNAWSNFASLSARQPQKLSEQLTQDFDADSSGTLNTDELQSLMDGMSSRSGRSASASAQDLLAHNDANGDGSLDSSELDAALSTMQPPPSTMAFAQSRSGGAGDDLFSKVDGDASGSVSSSELQALMSDMSGSAVSEDDAQAMFSALDSDGDGALSQTEFDAARPQEGGAMPAAPAAASTSSTASSTAAEGTQATSGAGGAGGTAAAGGTGGASSSTTYDELDTNEDGVVSASERLAGVLKEAAEEAASATVSDSSAASTKEGSNARNAFVQAAHLAYQMASGLVQPAQSTFSYAA